MKDTIYTITTVLLIIFILTLINVVWGAEINRWMQMSVRDAKMQDLFYLGMALLLFNSLGRPTPPSK